MKDYQEYLNRKNAPLPKIILKLLKKGVDLPIDQILSIEDKNQLLEKGYLNSENGFYHYKDGSAYAAVHTKMPKVTLEMINWWFWWHAKESVRYQIWYPEMHYDISSDFKGYYDDASKTYERKTAFERTLCYRRYWNRKRKNRYQIYESNSFWI